jgi:DNA-binding MarR family transcriptional regulator
MSSPEIERQERRAALVRELRRFASLGASYFRAAAAQTGMTDTDMQVLDLLVSGDDATAGQLAELTGLTTGAITGMLNRLEEAGLVRRERDPNDGRRVIVRLASTTSGQSSALGALATLGDAWDEAIARYDDGQLALLLDFLKRGDAATQAEILRLRAAPMDEGNDYTAPLADLASGRLAISGAIPQLRLRAEDVGANLYVARFEKSSPDIKVKDGAVTIRFPKSLQRSLLGLVKLEGSADITLNPTIPWRIAVQGGGTVIDAELGALKLEGLEIKAGGSVIRVALPTVTGVVPVVIDGSGSDIRVRRPAGVAARVHLTGWSTVLTFDGENFTGLGANQRLLSANYTESTPHYEIEVTTSASMVTVTDEE